MYKCLGDEWLIFKNACSLPQLLGLRLPKSFPSGPTLSTLSAPPTVFQPTGSKPWDPGLGWCLAQELWLLTFA